MIKKIVLICLASVLISVSFRVVYLKFRNCDYSETGLLEKDYEFLQACLLAADDNAAYYDKICEAKAIFYLISLVLKAEEDKARCERLKEGVQF